MQRSLPAFLLASLLLALSACGDEPVKPAEAPSPELPAAPVDSADPRSVFLAWQRALRDGRWEDAAGFSAPALATSLQEAARDSALASALPRGVVEGVECFVAGDRATCLYAVEDGDMLRLDSAALIRVARGWVIERVPAAGKKPVGHE